MSGTRRSARERGESDPIGALSVAHAALCEPELSAAELAGVRLGQARSISEAGGTVSFPATLAEFARGEEGAAPATDFSPGEQEIVVTVSVLYDIE